MSAFTVHRVIYDLPSDLSAMRTDALNEGHGFLERLVNDWRSGKCRFDNAGERLLVARSNNTLAGIGGLTVDPYEPSWMRMRRFYVRPSFRRSGAARTLAAELIRSSMEIGKQITVNAATPKGPAFWESLGFFPVEAEGHTHVYERRPDPCNS